MTGNGFQFMVTLYRNGGVFLNNWRITPAWNAEVECLRLEALRKGAPPDTAFTAPVQVEPVWIKPDGGPSIRGVRLAVRVGGADAAVREHGLTVFAPHAQQAAQECVAAGQLQEGETFTYAVAAFRRGEAPAPAGITVEECAPDLRLHNGDLARWLQGAEAHGPAHERDIPVFLARAVLDETARLAGRSADTETGGLLLGHLRYDGGVPEVFVEVTAQVPAAHARSDSTSFTLTEATWADAHRRRRERGADEQILGWWHSHPARSWCRECPPEKRAACSLQQCFFSAADREVHQAGFPRAYSVALVVTDAETGLHHDLYGWRDGEIADRAFLVPAAAGQN